MHSVTFSREFHHPLPNHRTAIYPPNVEIEVSNEVFDAAKKADALKPAPKPKKDEAVGE
jgi:hypothetical protein